MAVIYTFPQRRQPAAMATHRRPLRPVSEIMAANAGSVARLTAFGGDSAPAWSDTATRRPFSY